MSDEDKLERYGRLAMQLGISTVFAGVLLWFLLARLIAILDVMMVDLRAQTKALETIQRSLDQGKGAK